MFTIKLMNHYESSMTAGGAMSNELVISSDKYEVYKKEKLALLTVNGFTKQGKAISNTQAVCNPEEPEKDTAISRLRMASSQKHSQGGQC